MISRSDFSAVTLEEKEFFDRHFAVYPQSHSDNTFTNMVCWMHYAKYEFASSRGSVVLSSTIAGERRYRCPIGPPDGDLLEEVIQLAALEESEYPFMVMGEEDRSRLCEFHPEIPLVEARDLADYVYRTTDLAELRGRRYQNIRKEVNRFRQKCSYAVEEIGRENIAEVDDFLRRWCDWRDCDSYPVLAAEEEAVLFAIRHFARLKLSGLLIRVDGEVGAISIFEPLNCDTIVVHFEKGLPDCEGIYKAINMETAMRLRERYPFINRESDLGIIGLRVAKERYHPAHMVPVYLVRGSDLPQ
ncbi:MAG: phosphatidylglycerol lysyltransferase domain-containing protein [Methanomicrobiales archaeon]|nr:phosphatidylglycerol lysyltransferase domain-containing protein [Methanomicrobiales archaeon]